MNGKPLVDAVMKSSEFENRVHVELYSGKWEFFYTPEVDYILRCSTQMSEKNGNV